MTDIKNIYDIPVEFDSESSGTSFIDVGIHENVELKKITFNTTDKGNLYLAFTFADEDGRELSHTEWEPKDEDLIKFQSKTQNQIKRVHHIMTKFITKEEAHLKVSSFKEFAEAVINKLGSKFIGIKLRLKVIYSWNDYTSLPKYTPFVELMSISKEDSKLKISSIDKMVKDNKDRETTTYSNPFETVEGLQQGDITVASLVDSNTDDTMPF